MDKHEKELMIEDYKGTIITILLFFHPFRLRHEKSFVFPKINRLDGEAQRKEFVPGLHSHKSIYW